MPRKQITDGELHDVNSFQTKASAYHFMPGIVVAYHAGSAGKAQPSVDVQPAVHDVRFDPELGTRISEPWCVLPKVPLAMMQGGGCAIQFPMKKGDKVTLLAFDLDPSTFRGTGAAADPVFTRRHGGAFWHALPFDITDQGALSDPGANMVITVPAGALLLLGGGSDFVALAGKVNTELGKIADAFTSFVPGSGGASFGDPYTSAGDVSAAVVKAT